MSDLREKNLFIETMVRVQVSHMLSNPDYFVQKGIRLSDSEMSEIKSQILNGSYTFSPIRRTFLRKEDPRFNDISARCKVEEFPESKFGVKGLYFVFFSPEKDSAVFFVLSQVLMSIFHILGCMSPRAVAFRSSADPLLPLFEAISGWGKVQSLFVFKMKSYDFLKRPADRVLSSLEEVIGYEPLLRQIDIYLRTPIVDMQGNPGASEMKIPPCFPLSSLLIDFLLKDFDLALEQLYPGLPFARYFDHLFFPVILGESISPSDIVLAFERTSCAGVKHGIVTLTPGGHNVPVPGGFLRLAADGQVRFEKRNVYPHKDSLK